MAREGWGWPLRANRQHYFRDGRSVCHRWYYGGRLTGSGRERAQPDKCLACLRALAKEEAA